MKDSGGFFKVAKKETRLGLVHAEHDINAYYRALGKFVCDFAEIENTVILSFLVLVEVKDQYSFPLFSGLRTRDAITFIRRVFTAKHRAIPAHIDDAFRQIVFINNIRDTIFHYGIKIQRGVEAHSKRARPALHDDVVEVVRLSPDFLNDLCYDLETCTHKLAVRMGGYSEEELYTILPQSEERASQPWRCKRGGEEYIRLRFYSNNEEIERSLQSSPD